MTLPFTVFRESSYLLLAPKGFACIATRRKARVGRLVQQPTTLLPGVRRMINIQGRRGGPRYWLEMITIHSWDLIRLHPCLLADSASTMFAVDPYITLEVAAPLLNSPILICFIITSLSIEFTIKLHNHAIRNPAC